MEKCARRARVTSSLQVQASGVEKRFAGLEIVHGKYCGIRFAKYFHDNIQFSSCWFLPCWPGNDFDFSQSVASSHLQNGLTGRTRIAFIHIPQSNPWISDSSVEDYQQSPRELSLGSLLSVKRAMISMTGELVSKLPAERF